MKTTKTLYNMSAIRIKVVDEGFGPKSDIILQALTDQLEAEGWRISQDAPITLKVKFLIDNDHEKVLILLRETGSKVKIEECVLPYLPEHILGDIHTSVAAILLAQEV